MNDFQSIIVETVDEMPKAQPYVDKMGVTFDDEIHCRSKTTKEPLQNKDGTWRKKPALPGAKTESVIGQPTTLDRGARIQGHMAAGLVGTFFMGVFGQDLQPTDDDMHNMTDAFGRVFEHYGLEDLPPVWGAVVAVGFYALPKFQAPEPKARARYIYAKITGKRIAENAHDGNRTDEHGQDPSKQTNSKKLKK